MGGLFLGFGKSGSNVLQNYSTGPQARCHGGILGPCPPTRNVSPKRGLCPKKVTGFVPLECSSGSETPKILIINPVFVGKNRCFADFAMKTFFFFALHPRIRRIMWYAYFAKMTFFFLVFTFEFEGSIFLFPPKKIIYAPLPDHATLAPGLLVLNEVFTLPTQLIYRTVVCNLYKQSNTNTQSA